MEIIQRTLDFQLNQDTAVAIGKFDGVHIGHKSLLKEIMRQKAEGLSACVFTFDPSPAVFFGFGDKKVLTTKEEKRRIFREMGVDFLVEFPMTRESADTDPEDFARKYLSKALRARFICAGEDLSFGKKGLGNVALLQRLSGELDLRVQTIPKVCLEGKEVCSTYIRSLLEEGRMEQVRRLLGQPYEIVGRVEPGHRLGRTLGFPTANIYPREDKLLPPFGVYRSEVLVAGTSYHGISNVGKKPTVSGEEQVGVETYLYDFYGDLYGEEICVQLECFRRPEQKFGSIEELREQLNRDIARR